MSRHDSVSLVILHLVLLGLILSGSAWAVPGIQLFRSPAPPIAVQNDGLHSLDLTWSIEYNTNCTQPYLLEILDTAGNAIFQKSIPCGPSPINDGFSWQVPQGLACGCYYARLTFYSDWCAACPNCFEDQAEVSFLVSANARLTVCKFLDKDGDGIRDPGEGPLAGWLFKVENCNGLVIAEGRTGLDGCVTFDIPVECVGTTTVWVRDVLEPGWEQTTQGGVNPFPVVLTPGSHPEIWVGNWRPIHICGYKFLDQARWPWKDPHWKGPEGQENPPCMEPVPPIVQPLPPAPCYSPFQECKEPPDRPDLWILHKGIAGVEVELRDANGNWLQTVVTDQDGEFCFGVHWDNKFTIIMHDPAPNPPACDPPRRIDDWELPRWEGKYFPTVATSVWPRTIKFHKPPLQDAHQLDITLPQPEVPHQEYGCNYFFNRHPSRLFGEFCDEALAVMGAQPELPVTKDGFRYPKASIDPRSGFYMVPELSEEPEGLRPGVFTLQLPELPTPDWHWRVKTYCDPIRGDSEFIIPYNGSVDVEIKPGIDVRVDFCVDPPQENRRQCFIPVTFTQQGWHDFCDPYHPIVPGGMVYNRFRFAFANYTFFGTTFTNKVIIGQGDKTISFEGTTSGLNRLCYFLPQSGPPNKLDHSYTNPVATPAGALAGELLALQMNIAYNDRRLMPRTPGYDLEKFRLADSVFKGKTVGQVRDIANAVLAGASPSNYGLSGPPAGYAELADILARINANYEFVNFDIYNDRKFLIPNRPLGQSDPPTPVIVPTP